MGVEGQIDWSVASGTRQYAALTGTRLMSVKGLRSSPADGRDFATAGLTMLWGWSRCG